MKISPTEFKNFKRAYFIDGVYEDTQRVGEAFCLDFEYHDDEIFYSTDCWFVLNYIKETYVEDSECGEDD